MADDKASPYAGKVVVVMDREQFSALMEQLWVCDTAKQIEYQEDVIRHLSELPEDPAICIIRSLWNAHVVNEHGKTVNAASCWRPLEYPFDIKASRWPSMHLDLGCYSIPAVIDISTADPK